MLQVVDYKEFEELKELVLSQVDELNFLRSLLVQVAWLDRTQTMQALDVSHETLRRIHLAGELTFRYQGDRPFYCIYSIRAYLMAKKIEPKAAERRILIALTDKNSKKNPTKTKRIGRTSATV
ncbi:hypothetical protein WBJ53_26290 [Spirosoma sp. SC4-14]|uniref:hypothetical protein n=1 Tax=Spirosoma sp. SC4-14 TaxID=3128900 RepID=UPI0030CC6A7D